VNRPPAAPARLEATLRASEPPTDPEIPCSGEILDPSTKASDGVGRCVRFLRGPFEPLTPLMPERKPAPGAASQHARAPPTRPFNLAPHVSWFPQPATVTPKSGSRLTLAAILGASPEVEFGCKLDAFAYAVGAMVPVVPRPRLRGRTPGGKSI